MRKIAVLLLGFVLLLGIAQVQAQEFAGHSCFAPGLERMASLLEHAIAQSASVDVAMVVSQYLNTQSHGDANLSDIVSVDPVRNHMPVQFEQVMGQLQSQEHPYNLSVQAVMGAIDADNLAAVETFPSPTIFMYQSPVGSEDSTVLWWQPLIR